MEALVYDLLIGAVLSLALLLLTALVVYEKQLSTTIKAKFAKTIKGSVLGPGPNSSQVIGKWLRILCMISFALCMCNCINDLVYYNVQMNSASQCTAPRNLGVSLLTTLDFSIYLFLWLRQYLVYQSINLDPGPTRTIIRILQWGALTLIIGIFVSTNSLVACCRRYSYNETSESCYETTTDSVNAAISYMWSVGSLILHCSLVVMFAFPLVKVALKKRGEPTVSNKDSQKRMIALVRRCFILSFACIVTDITVMLVSLYALHGGKYSQLRHFLYNINVLLNCIFIVISFKEWKAMLLPCLTIKRRRSSSVGIAYTSSSHLGKEKAAIPD